MTLTYHGKSKEICEFVVKTYDKPEYSNNKTIQTWVKESKLRLKEINDV